MILFNNNGTPFCYACDWMQYSVRLSSDTPEFYCPEGYRIEIMVGNNVFRHRALVWDVLGNKWLTLLWSPYSPRLNSRIMTVQLANQWLYSGMIARSIDLLQMITECEFNSLGRVDVCVDWEITNTQLECLHNICSGGMYVQGKREGSIWWHDANGKKENFKTQAHCLSFGSPTSEIKVKCYFKSREQGMLSAYPEPEKPWIVDRWRQAGMNDKNVWRLEFSLQSSGQLRYQRKPMSLDQFGDEYFVARVLNGLYDKRFIVRRNDGKRGGHKNGDRVVDFLRLPDVPSAELKWQGVTHSFSSPASIALLRRLMSDIDNPALMSSVDMMSQYEGMIRTCVARNGLQSYFENHYGADIDTFFATRDCGEGIHEVNVNFRNFFN